MHLWLTRSEKPINGPPGSGCTLTLAIDTGLWMKGVATSTKCDSLSWQNTGSLETQTRGSLRHHREVRRFHTETMQGWSGMTSLIRALGTLTVAPGHNPSFLRVYYCFSSSSIDRKDSYRLLRSPRTKTTFKGSSTLWQFT